MADKSYKINGKNIQPVYYESFKLGYDNPYNDQQILQVLKEADLAVFEYGQLCARRDELTK